MRINLTEGAISVLSGDDAQYSDLKPVLQVADIRLINTTWSQSDNERYRILLSDGSFTQQGMLATELNYLVHTRKLQKGSIVQLMQCMCHVVMNRRVVIVKDLDVIVDKCDIIGEPKQFPTNTDGNVSSVTSSTTPVQPMNQLAGGGGGGGMPPSYSAGNRGIPTAGSGIADSVPRPLVGGGIHSPPSGEDLGRQNASNVLPMFPQTGAASGVYHPPPPSYNQPPQTLNREIPKIEPLNLQRMSINLTEGAISVLLGDDAQNSDIQPVLQVAEMHLININKSQSDNERYRILLSDGSFTQQGILVTQRNYLVRTGKLQKGSIVKLVQFVCNVVQNRRFLIIIDLEVIVDKCDIIGKPKQFPTNTDGNVSSSYSAGNRGIPTAGSVIGDSVPRPLVGGGIHTPPSRVDLGRQNASNASPMFPQTGAASGVYRPPVNNYVCLPPSYNQPPPMFANSDIKPVLQVADIRLVNTTWSQSDNERYRILLLLSDGSFTQQGMLATQLNYLVHTGKLQKGSIVQLMQFVCNIIENHRIVSIEDLDVIVDKCDIIGEPKKFGFFEGSIPLSTNATEVIAKLHID